MNNKGKLIWRFKGSDYSKIKSFSIILGFILLILLNFYTIYGFIFISLGIPTYLFYLVVPYPYSQNIDIGYMIQAGVIGWSSLILSTILLIHLGRHIYWLSSSYISVYEKGIKIRNKSLSMFSKFIHFKQMKGIAFKFSTFEIILKNNKRIYVGAISYREIENLKFLMEEKFIKTGILEKQFIL